MQKTKLRVLWVLLALVMFLPAGSALAVSANDIVGKWVTPGGKSNVEIKKSGNGYVGKLIWLKEPNRNGKPKTDMQNPNKALQSRPLIGLSLLSNFVFKGDHWEGTIYNPEDGKSYSCNLTLTNANTLQVRGYVLNPAFGKTQVWSRKK